MASRKNASAASHATKTTKTTKPSKPDSAKTNGKTEKKQQPEPAAPAKESRKRKHDDAETAPTAPPKKTKVAAAASTSQAKAEPLNAAPKQALDVFVFGQGENAELGLGSKKYNGKLRPTGVRRPRINHNLDATKVGVVQAACGGMHAVVLTRDNKILTWGVNDDKALGRDTTWDGGLRDMDAGSDSEDDDNDDSGLNPRESTPDEVDLSGVAEDVVFTKVQASNSASFALTADGHVYGWGTFRGADGIIGFSEGVKVQPTPVQIPHLTGIKDIAAGSDHVLALDKAGRVLTWGSGGQFQLGRRPVTRRASTLKPEAVGRFNTHQAVKIFACGYQSFYIDNHGKVWSWGLNNYGQTGHAEGAGEDGSLVLHPRVVKALEEHKVNCVTAGSFHGAATTADGQLLTWGRIDGHQVGHKAEVYNEENTIYRDERPRILVTPTVVPSKCGRLIKPSGVRC
jgi:regulator of chromosome condensation